MQSKEKNDLILARFFPGENVIEELKNVCFKHHIKTGVVLSALGQLAQCELGFFKEKGNYLNQKFESPYELLSLTGIMSGAGDNYDFHLHATLAGPDKSVRGGHLINGVVSVTLEIAIMKSAIQIKRILEEDTGLKGLFLH